MQKVLEKTPSIEYNLDRNNVNIYEIRERDYSNPYGHIKEFMKLDYKTRFNAHRVVSNKVVLAYSDGLIYDVAIDVNGNLYYFEIFSDSSYRITNIEKSKENIKEVANETNIN